jgi:hypothetical protein
VTTAPWRWRRAPTRPRVLAREAPLFASRTSWNRRLSRSCARRPATPFRRSLARRGPGFRWRPRRSSWESWQSVSSALRRRKPRGQRSWRQPPRPLPRHPQRPRRPPHLPRRPRRRRPRLPLRMAPLCGIQLRVVPRHATPRKPAPCRSTTSATHLRRSAEHHGGSGLWCQRLTPRTWPFHADVAARGQAETAPRRRGSAKRARARGQPQEGGL